MKILFLDNDGVICLANNWGTRFEKAKRYAKEHDIPTEGFYQHDLPVDVIFDDFDKGAVKVLNSILEQTGAEIVVSSDWKLHANLGDLGDYYEAQGIIKRPISVTQRFNFSEWNLIYDVPDRDQFPWSREYDLEQSRHFEILKWLKDNQHLDITHWVAVDDLDMGQWIKEGKTLQHRDWGLTNFVWTPRSREGIKQSGIKDKILKYLT